MIKKIILLSMCIVSTNYGMELDEQLLDALREENTEQMEELIDKEGADPNSWKSKLGLSLLHHAVLCDKIEFVKLLADRGAKLDSQDTKGWTPIHFAAATDNEVILKELLKYDSKQIYLKKNNNGESPLLLALRMGNQKAAQKLYSHGGTDALVDL